MVKWRNCKLFETRLFNWQLFSKDIIEIEVGNSIYVLVTRYAQENESESVIGEQFLHLNGPASCAFPALQ